MIKAGHTRDLGCRDAQQLTHCVEMLAIEIAILGLNPVQDRDKLSGRMGILLALFDVIANLRCQAVACRLFHFTPIVGFRYFLDHDFSFAREKCILTNPARESGFIMGVEQLVSLVAAGTAEEVVVEFRDRRVFVRLAELFLLVDGVQGFGPTSG